MYCQFYGFREKPFSLIPDPDFFYLSQKHETALNLLELGILNQSGFCIISGEIGAGKTTLVRELLNRLDDRVRVGLISNTHSTFSDLLGWILAAYELESESGEAVFQHRRFTDFTIEQYASGKHTLLIIDEAQNLSLSALEQLRMLSNINSEKDLVLQIILVGQNELRTKLQQPELRQFAQRVAIDYHLAALDQKETAAYIKHRVIKSGGSQQLFDDNACRLVHQYSAGIPRLINRICDLSLVYGFSKSKKIIGADLIKAVTEDQKIDQPIEKPVKKTTGKHHSPIALNKAETPSGNATTRGKVSSGPVQQSTGHSETAFKRNNRRSPSNKTSKNTTELKPPEKRIVKKEAKLITKEAKTHLTQAASSVIYAAAEKASAEKARAESIATEKNCVASAILEKSKADAIFAEKAGVEKLNAEKEVTEKKSAERAAAKRAEASMAAAKLANSERIAAEKAALKSSSAAQQATESIARKKQTADELVAGKTRIERQLLKETSAAKAASEKALAERIAAEKAAAETAASADAALRKAAQHRIAAEKAAADMVSDSEAAAKSALARQADAERIVSEKAATERTATENASTDKELAQLAATERASTESIAREKAMAAKQATQTAAASRAAAEKALAEKNAADTIAKEKVLFEKTALAKVAVSVAAAAQQAADRAAAAQTAAQQEAREKEAAAITAARKAAEANALAEKVAAESCTDKDVTGIYIEKEAGIKPHSANHPLPAGTQPAILVRHQSQTTPPRRARTILAVTVISVIVAASTWVITNSSGSGAIKNIPAVAGKSFAIPERATEAAALESGIRESAFRRQTWK